MKMNSLNDTKSDAYKSLFVVVKDNNSDKIKRIAIPHDVQIGLKDVPFDAQFFGRFALSTVVYDVNSVNGGSLQIDNHATIASITASDTSNVTTIRIALPLNPIVGQVHFIKDASGIASQIAMVVSSSDLIDGSSSLSITTSHQSVILYWDGLTWHVLSSGSGGGGGGAPTDATYVTLTTNPSLTNERTLTAGTGVKLTDGGAGLPATLAINDSVVATLSGANFTGNVKFTSGMSGSLQQLATGIPYLAGGTNINVATQSNGQVVVSSTSTSFDNAVSFVTLANSSSVPNARRLAAGSGVTVTDDGVNTVTIAATGGGGGSVDPNAPIVTTFATSSVPGGRTLTAGYGMAVTDDGPGGSVVISSTASDHYTLGANYSVVSSSNAFAITSSNWDTVTGITASINTSGGPVMLMVQSSFFAQTNGAQSAFTITRNGTNLGDATNGLSIIGPRNVGWHRYSNLFFIDRVPSGTYTYAYKAKAMTGTGVLTNDDCGPATLTAIEMPLTTNFVSSSMSSSATITGDYTQIMSTGLVPTKYPVLLVAVVNPRIDGADNWGAINLYKGTTMLGSQGSAGIQTCCGHWSNDYCSNIAVWLDSTPTFNAPNYYSVKGKLGGGTSVTFDASNTQHTLYAIELSDINFKFAYSYSPTYVSAPNSVNPIGSELQIMSRGRPVLMLSNINVNAYSSDNRTGLTYVKNGVSLTTASKGMIIVDSSGINSFNECASLLALDTNIDNTTVSINNYKPLVTSISGTSQTSEVSLGCSLFVYEIPPAGTNIVNVGGWVDVGNRLLTTSSIVVTGSAQFATGLSGSLQQLTSGIPYLIGGSNASVVTQSNGQVVVSSIPLVPHLPAPDANTLSQLTFVTDVTSSFGQLCVPVDAVNATPWTISMVYGGYSRICPLGRSLYPQKQTSWRIYTQHVATGLEPTSALTMNVWITVPNDNYLASGQTFGRVITKFHTTDTWQSGAYNVNGIWFVGTSLAFFLQTNGGSKNSYTEIASITDHIPPGTRALLSMTYVNNYLACYINGTYVGGAIGSGNIFWGNSGQWVLGSLPVSSYMEHFPGDIESFQLDNVARSSDWLATYYKQGLGLVL